MDWGFGNYELTARKLEEAAHAVVAQANLRAGERIVDLGTGTGNAALLAAEAGAVATGVDPAPRLIEVATERAREAGLAATFGLGEAAAMDLPDDSADAILSVFGLIFAPDEVAAASEIARVLKPGGRLAYSAWLPTGTMAEAVGALMRGFGNASSRRFAWHEQEDVDELFRPYGLAVSHVVEPELRFAAQSPAAYLDAELANHPLWLAGFAQLRGEDAAAADRLRDELLAIFTAGNEDPDAFAITSAYRILTIS
ncbi:MAG: class I SAM-dependent methyltransferase [Solirubrobacteraceae bacterium]|nr:class I SAM-dependent methyltransferase [Solirubrobacteraceae bacterium]